MRTSLNVMLVFFALLTNGCFGQAPNGSNAGSNSNPCVDGKVQELISSLKAKYPQFEKFTSVIETSRLLFEELLIETFTAASLKEYCSDYEKKRNAIDSCADSSAKTVSLNGFTLADYVCIKRLEDFAHDWPCIVQVAALPNARYTEECSSYEKGSKAYLDPLRSEINTADAVKHYKAADCVYLKCRSDSRRPAIDKQCGRDAEGLESSALSAIFSADRKSYQNDQQSFPAECRALILIEAADDPAAGNASVTPAPSNSEVNASNGLATTIISTAAPGAGGSVNGSVVTVATSAPVAASNGSAVTAGAGGGNGTVTGSGVSGATNVPASQAAATTAPKSTATKTGYEKRGHGLYQLAIAMMSLVFTMIM